MAVDPPAACQDAGVSDHRTPSPAALSARFHPPRPGSADGRPPATESMLEPCGLCAVPHWQHLAAHVFLAGPPAVAGG